MLTILRSFIARWYILFPIVLLGAYLRLYKINEYLTFLGDEGRDVLVVKRMIVDGKWTLLGPTASVGGFYMGPVYYYFMAPFLWLWNLDPVGPAIMVALFGIATIILLYVICEKIFGKYTAVIASTLYALSPVVIAYSRASWNPNIVPFFSTLLLYITYIIVKDRHWKYTFWIGVLFGIGLQLHYTFLFLIPVVILWLLIHGHTNEHFKWYGLIVVGFMVGFSPFIAFEFRHNFSNTRGIIQFIAAGKDTGFSFITFFSNIQAVFFRLFARLIIRIPDGGMFTALTDVQRNVWTCMSWLIAGVSLVVPFLLSRKIRTTPFVRQAIHLILLWLIIVLCSFGLYKKSIYDYYFGIFFTLPFILFAISLDRIRYFGRIGKIVSIGAFAALIYFNWQGRPFAFEPNNQLEQTKILARAVLDKTDGKPFNFALITGGNSDQAYRYFFEIWGRPPVTIENTQIDPERKTVTDQLLIICEDPNCMPLGNSLWEVAGFGRAEIVGSWDVSVLKVYKLKHYTETLSP